jgi:hypothetical protein
MGGVMTDLLSKMERDRKEAAKFSDLAKSASLPFLQAYYWRVAQRYLSSEGELKLPQGQGNFIAKQGGLSSTEHARHTLRR